VCRRGDASGTKSTFSMTSRQNRSHTSFRSAPKAFSTDLENSDRQNLDRNGRKWKASSADCGRDGAFSLTLSFSFSPFDFWLAVSAAGGDASPVRPAACTSVACAELPAGDGRVGAADRPRLGVHELGLDAPSPTWSRQSPSVASIATSSMLPSVSVQRSPSSSVYLRTNS